MEEMNLHFTGVAGGAGEDEGAQAVGVGGGVGGAGPAAHRLADEDGGVELEVVEEGEQVVGEAGEAGAAGGLGGEGEAAVGEHDAGAAGGEVGQLLPPAEVVAAEAVGEDHHRPRAGVGGVGEGEEDLEPHLLLHLG